MSTELLCLYSATVSEQNDTYTIELPKREIEHGTVQCGETYRVAVLSSLATDSSGEGPSEAESTDTAPDSRDRAEKQEPPVSAGETREVEIEGLGDQGDGIAKVERGYVLIVPDTGVGERVTVRVDRAKENVGFAEVIKRHHDVSSQ